MAVAEGSGNFLTLPKSKPSRFTNCNCDCEVEITANLQGNQTV